MYGSAESVVGELLKKVSNKQALFAATKVWTYGKRGGIEQMQNSMRRMGVDVMDLMQIHNLRDWKIHLPTLRQWKEEGKIRYIGITTSHGRLHAELEQIMQKEPLDFVQFSYSIGNRTVEDRLLPLAADRGVATLINRPFERGELFQRVKGKSLPDWSVEFDCRSWGQFFLKFIVSHPAVTCVIPATSKVHHMQDNMSAGLGHLPTETMRRRMIDTMESL
jgi:diketogulonate reductase-like aldo/keto reductase